MIELKIGDKIKDKTTRRHPRTMHGCDAAWPMSADYASAVRRYKSHSLLAALSRLLRAVFR